MLNNKKNLLIGLTGGIGSGKSTVAAMFAALGVPIIDADEISRGLVAPGTPLLAMISQHFGENVIDSQGQLRRDRLRARIFSSPADKQWLENLLHPPIYAAIRERALMADFLYVIAVIPLLCETGRDAVIDRVLVVDAPEALQKQRAAMRDHRDIADIEAIMRAQWGRDQRLAAANDVIYNEGDLATLKQQVEKLHHSYLNLAKHLSLS